MEINSLKMIGIVRDPVEKKRPGEIAVDDRRHADERRNVASSASGPVARSSLNSLQARRAGRAPGAPARPRARSRRAVRRARRRPPGISAWPDGTFRAPRPRHARSRLGKPRGGRNAIAKPDEREEHGLPGARG